MSLFIMAASVAAAAVFNVKGLATDPAGEPEIYATVRVYAEGDTLKPVSLGTTDDEGRFDQQIKNAGSYRLTISSVGKQTAERVFTVDGSSPVADLGTIAMEERSNELGEVSVVAQRPLVVREIDRIGYDVKADPDSETSNLREILRKVPLVSVESDGTIKVKGSDSFKIYKNGRPNNSFTKNAKDIFAAIPASTIKKIEVITDPGAREDAEGVGTILNIVTDQETTIKGVVGSVGLNASLNSPVPSPNLWLSTQIGKVTMAVNGGYGTKTRHRGKSWSQSETEYFDSGNRRVDASESRSAYDMEFAGLEASWEPDTLNLFTVEMNLFAYGSHAGIKSFSESSLYGSDGSLLSFYRTTTNPLRNRYLDLDGAANYQRSTRRKGETLTLSYRISTTNQKMASENEYSDMVNWDMPYTGLNSSSDLRFIEQTVQADWTRPFGKIHKLDIGGKGIFRDNHSLSDYQYIGLRDTHDDFTHRTSIAAAYADYRVAVGKWNFRAGLRYEYSYLSAKFKAQTENHPDFHANLHDWVPSLAVSWNMTDVSALKLSFNRNISRPGISYLDPTRSESPVSVSYGNPDLESEVYNNLSVNYSFFGPKINLDVSAGGSLVDNAIASSQWLEDGRFFSTYANIAKRRTAYLSLYVQWSITPKTRIMANMSLNYRYYRQPAEIDGEGNVDMLSKGGWSFNPYVRFSQNLPWGVEMAVMGYWWSGAVNSVYSYSKPDARNIGYHISFNKKFLKDNRLTVNVGVGNIFGPGTTRYTSITENPAYRTDSRSFSDGNRNVNISLSYRFGSLNASVKKTAASITNDDLQGRKK